MGKKQVLFWCLAGLLWPVFAFAGNAGNRERQIDSIIRAYKDSINDTTLALVYYLDSLDLNFDNINDLVVITDYTMTGQNKMWDVFYYNPNSKHFFADAFLHGMANPRFVKTTKTIYTHYLGTAVASGKTLVWEHGQWRLTKQFSVVPAEDDTVHFSIGKVMDAVDNPIGYFYDDNYPPDSLYK